MIVWLFGDFGWLLIFIMCGWFGLYIFVFSRLILCFCLVNVMVRFDEMVDLLMLFLFDLMVMMWFMFLIFIGLVCWVGWWLILRVGVFLVGLCVVSIVEIFLVFVIFLIVLMVVWCVGLSVWVWLVFLVLIIKWIWLLLMVKVWIKLFWIRFFFFGILIFDRMWEMCCFFSVIGSFV